MSDAAVTRDKSWLETFLAFFERRLIAVLFLGFSSGLPLALTAATLQIRQTEAGVDLTTIGFFALVGVSYSLKFVWAPLIDRSMPPMPFAALGHRRGWTLLFQIGLMIAITALGLLDPATAMKPTAALAAVVAFLSASQDIVIDAYRIELLDKEQQGSGAAMTQYGYRLGMLVSGAGALFIAEYVSWFAAYLTMAALMGVGIITVLMTREPQSQRRRDVASEADQASFLLRVGFIAVVTSAAFAIFLMVQAGVLALQFAVLPDWLPILLADWTRATAGWFVALNWVKWAPNIVATLAAAATPVVIVALLPTAGPRSPAQYRAVRTWLDTAVMTPFAEIAQRQGWALILLFIVLFKLGDAVLGSMASPFYIKIGFTKPEIAEVSKVFGLVATLAGVYLGGLMVMKMGMGKSLLLTGILQLGSNLLFAWQAHVGAEINWLYLTIGVENFTGGMGSAAFVAYISRLCSLEFTATQYALFSSLAVLGRTVISSPMGGVAEAIGWVDYFLLSTVMAVPGVLLLIYMLRRFPVTIETTPHAAADAD
jgi:PAT family beta-lactamase induction signal transducer AmpG